MSEVPYMPNVVEHEDLERFKQAVIYASDHIIITDHDGVIVFANAAATTTTGYEPEEMIGNTPSLWGAQMNKSFYKDMWHTIAIEKKVFRGEITNKRKNGELYEAEVHIAPILNKDGEPTYFVGIERDISGQKKLERARKQFISLASHNLKAPLSSMRWYSEMLLDGDVGRLNTKQREFVQEIHEAATRMTSLVLSLLNISRIELGTYIFDPTETDIAKVVQDTVHLLEERITQKELILEAFYENNLPKVRTDAQMFSQVVQNLLTNAIKYNRTKGKLDIKLFKKKRHEEVYGKTFDSDMLVLVVKDEGIGIPALEQEKVFQRFFRASNAEIVDADGTGIGLYLVRATVEQMHGSLWFSSKEGVGTEFYVALPVINQ